jgi:hypothetical protein
MAREFEGYARECVLLRTAWSFAISQFSCLE